MKAATGMWSISSVILSTWVITLSTLLMYLPGVRIGRCSPHMPGSQKVKIFLTIDVLYTIRSVICSRSLKRDISLWSVFNILNGPIFLMFLSLLPLRNKLKWPCWWNQCSVWQWHVYGPDNFYFSAFWQVCPFILWPAIITIVQALGTFILCIPGLSWRPSAESLSTSLILTCLIVKCNQIWGYPLNTHAMR